MKCAAQPSDTLPAAISSVLQQAEKNLGFQAGTLEVSSVSSSRSSSSSRGASTAAVEVQTLPLQQWAPGAGRLVGTQLWPEVLAREKEEEGGELKGLLGKLLHGQQVQQQQLSTQQQQLSTLAKPRVSNAAASILLLALGQQRFTTTTTDYAANLLADPTSPVHILAQEEHLDPKDLAIQVDRLVERRNALHHPGNLHALDVEVLELGPLPHLRGMKWECWLLERYQRVKELFGDRFEGEVFV